MLPHRCWLIGLLLCARAFAEPEPGILPVYIEDNHAGSFGWFAAEADLDAPHTLVLVDAHSDGSAAAHSDAVREGLRRVSSEAQRAERVAEWRANGRIQAYNWIEPLMPAPVAEVVWLGRPKLNPEEKRRLLADAVESVDGRLEFEARAAGELGGRWRLVDVAEFERWQPGGAPVLATIDLDFFAEASADDAAALFHRIWTRLMGLTRLQAVSFCVSRPWLHDDAQAFRLLRMALEEVRLVRGARIAFEPFAVEGPDDSLQAREYAKRGAKAPRLRLEEAPADLRAFLSVHRERFQVRTEAERWTRWIEGAEEQCGRWEVRPDGIAVSTDGIWRLRAGDEPPALRIWSETAAAAPARVRWWALRPAANAYNLLPSSGLGKEWTQESGPWVREERCILGETADGALAPERWRAGLDSATGWGRVRIEAEVETPAGWIPTPTVELRVGAGDGFHAGLSEQFGLPYVFGAGFARDAALDGPETGWGNDCANFLIAAWRRAGRALPWGNPAQLRSRLRTLAEEAGVDSGVRMSADDVRRGVAIDFGRHVAALWEDRAPVGVLDAGDLVVHHLGGFPERVPLGELASQRPRFAVRTLPREPACRILIGGDAVLADASPEDVRRIAALAREADLTILNLEGAPGPEAVAPAKRYRFAFPPERLSWLREAGVSAVGMANNHADDAGTAGFLNGVRAVEEAGMAAFGAGGDVNAAARPWLVEKNGVRLAFFAVSCVEAEAAGPGKPGVAVLPDHADILERALREAKEDGRTVIVLAHWGREYAGTVQEEQRQWARWLIDRGADVVAGAHPHVVEATDSYRGKPVAYSLGNAIYPARLKGADNGAWWDLELDARGEIVSAALHPIER